MKDYLSYKRGKYINIYISLLCLSVFFYKIQLSLLSECPREKPIRINGGDCVEGGCKLSLFESGNCTIENDIIRTQKINRIIQYSDISIRYDSIATTPNGDLVCISYPNNGYTQFFFGLKKNGRPYFLIDDQESCFTNITTDKTRKEGNIFAIKLNSTNDEDKEYIISFGSGDTNFEIYDFSNNNVYRENVTAFFNAKSFKSINHLYLN